MSDPNELTAKALAERLGGTLAGDGAVRVSAAATLEEAGPGDVSWIGTAAARRRVADSKAAVLLIGPCDAALPGRTCIRVDDPDRAMCAVLEWLAPPWPTLTPGIHPAACVAESADVGKARIGPLVFVGERVHVGEGTRLFPGVYVGDDAVIGRDCVLWPNVVVRERVTIGDRVIVHPNSTIGADGFGYLQREGRHIKIPQTGTVVVEDDVEIGANTTIDRARSGSTRIGRGTKIDNLVQIAHNVQIGEHCVIVAQTGVGGSSRLGSGTMLSGQVGVFDHVTIGEGARVAAKSLISKNVEAGTTVRGLPAVDLQRALRQEAAVRKLPEWMVRIRELEQRLAAVERRLQKAES